MRDKLRVENMCLKNNVGVVMVVAHGTTDPTRESCNYEN